ncbi:hypothetical protein LCGC14_0382950 [marine sediment metagenome]|uniref:LamG-like jellyroll fold domain-containing protein n=1 Tax=marine sediment metagenome TaxID=412755 RepID=A0A0F9VNS5_9ZZZZ
MLGLRQPRARSLWSYNPIPGGCELYIPAFHNSIRGPVFKSVDPFGHIGAVSGATKVNKGFFFDALDDEISVPDAPSITDIFSGGGTILAWINPASDGEAANGRILDKQALNKGYDFRVAEQSGSDVKLGFFKYFDGVDGFWRTSSVEITINQWTLVAIAYDSGSADNNPLMYVNGLSVTVAEIATPTGTAQSDSGEDITIGAKFDNSETWDGLIGECWMYNRILTPAEITYIHQRTRGRY